MSNFINKFGRAMRKGNLFMVLVIVLVVVIVLVSLYFALFTKQTAGTGIPANPTPAASGDSGIPEFDIPLNTYDLSKFSSDNGVITYSGGDSWVGIDVSEHQGEIDWKAVKESGIDFAIIRACWRGNTRGKIYDDKYFTANIEGAIENGIQVGAYVFSQSTSLEEAEAEAAYIVNQLSKYKDKITMPVVFDWEHVEPEGNESIRTENAKGEDVSKFAAAFCKNIAKAGYTPMVYMNKSLAYKFYNLETIQDYDFWVAEYETKPSFYYDFTIWQYSDSGKVNGIKDKVDVNIAFKAYK